MQDQDSVKTHGNNQMLVKALDFPVTKTEILHYAAARGAAPEVLAELSALPADHYRTLEDLCRSLKLIERMPGTNKCFFSAQAGEANHAVSALSEK